MLALKGFPSCSHATVRTPLCTFVFFFAGARCLSAPTNLKLSSTCTPPTPVVWFHTVVPPSSGLMCSLFSALGKPVRMALTFARHSTGSLATAMASSATFFFAPLFGILL